MVQLFVNAGKISQSKENSEIVMIETLKQIELFNKLSDSELEKLSQISRLRKVAKGEIIFFEKEEPKYLHVIKKGRVKLYKTNIKASQIFLHSFEAVSLIAELANFENIPYPATAQATEDGELILIDFKKLENDFFKNPDISYSIIYSLSQKLKIISQFLHQETALSAEARVANYIINSSEDFGKIKDSQIASFVNIAPETFSRVLSKFKKEGFIKQNRNRKIYFKDIEALNKIIE